MSNQPPPQKPRPEPNERRADRAMLALAAGTARALAMKSSTEVASDLIELLANLRHICDRFGLEYATADRRAYGVYRETLAGADKVAAAGREAFAGEATPLGVLTLRGDGFHYRSSSVGSLCEDALTDPDYLPELWARFVEALCEGRGQDDERWFFVNPHQRPQLAAQMLALRDAALSHQVITDAMVPEPEPGLASYLV